MNTRASSHFRNPLALSAQSEENLKSLSKKTYFLVGSIVIVDFLLGIFMIGDGYPIPGLGIPASAISLFGICGLGLMRKPKNYTGPYFPAFIVLLVAVSWTLVVSLNAGVPTEEVVRRASRIYSVVLATMFIVEQRIDIKSFFKGILVGLVLNLVLFYAGVAPDAYSGALTGYLGDKNKAALFYLIGGLLAAAIATKKTHIFGIYLFTSVAVWLTGSRTTLAALFVAIVWAYLATHFTKIVRIFSAIGLVLFVRYIEENYARVGSFVDRLGSDLLRERIDEASYAKVMAAPFEGLGFGEATVIIDGNRWFFHNSYWTLQVEGGMVYLILVAGITIILGFGFFRDSPYLDNLRKAEGVIAAILVAAWKLGEVFLTNAWMMAVGFLILSSLQASGQASKFISEDDEV